MAQALYVRNRRVPIVFALFEPDELPDTVDRGPRPVRAAALAVTRSARRRAGAGAAIVPVNQHRVLLVLPDIPLEAALILADGVRHDVSGYRPPAGGEPLTISGGVVMFPVHGRRSATLANRLVSTLLRARATGGNRVVALRESPTAIKAATYPLDMAVRLAQLAGELRRSETALLREALRDLIAKYERER